MTRTMRQAEIHDSAGCSVCGWSAGGRSGLPAPHRPPAVWGVPGLGQAGDALGEEAGAVDLLGDAGAVEVRGDAAEVERPAGAEDHAQVDVVRLGDDTVVEHQLH